MLETIICKLKKANKPRSHQKIAKPYRYKNHLKMLNRKTCQIKKLKNNSLSLQMIKGKSNSKNKNNLI